MQTPESSLRAIRKARGLTLADLSKMADISVGSIGNYETGARGLSREAIQRIADVLQISATTLTACHAPKAVTDQQVREPPAPYGACRIPEACDLPARLDAQDSRLATIEARLDTLVRLLGASLAPTSNAAHPRRAG